MRSSQTLFTLLLWSLLTVLSGCHKQPPPEKLTRGGELYGRMCAVCHGANGEGYKADQAPRLAQPDFQASVSDQYLREAIKNGRMGTTMSAWSTNRGGPLADHDVEELIKFLRTWSKGARATLDEKPANGDMARGSNTYARECFSCHGVKGVGGPNIHIGNPQLMQTATNGYVRYAIRKGRTGTQMPSFSPKLSDSDIEDVVALLRTWASPPPPEPPVAPAPPIPLGPVPLNPKGSDPVGFKPFPATTPMAIIHAQLERGARMVLLDARAQSDYLNQHIAGAVSVPFFDPSPYLDKLPKNSWLVCYCACPHAESGQLAAKLQQAGFKKVTVLDEGLGAWTMQKYATSSGEKP
ncbi:MAG TPA: c-type cytochrome [Polyangiaceae bacterium]|jgi:cytochrome c oxidase cbb3-type subunit 3/ubiquinol-cytochrome c reductase cytochrome c subunit|nr:c-type cytochrome [Polyangiaceae bacterium]